jgi:SAM-dependent methyltransferase
MTACAACAGGPLVDHLKVPRAPSHTGLIPTSDLYGYALSDLVRCTACGHVQLEEMPSDEQLRNAYADAEEGLLIEQEVGQRATARRALERIERFREPGRMLDVGCWVGFLLSEARERGWEVEGIEPSRYASDYAREQLGLTVQTVDLLEARVEPADVISMGDVIEHLVRPDEALARLRELLRPGGILYLALPDAGSPLARRLGRRWWAVLPTHVQYFSRASLGTLMHRCGFVPVWMGTDPKAFAIDYYLWRLEGYWPPLSHAARAGARKVGVADRLWAPDFRDRLAVVARVK